MCVFNLRGARSSTRNICTDVGVFTSFTNGSAASVGLVSVVHSVPQPHLDFCVCGTGAGSSELEVKGHSSTARQGWFLYLLTAVSCSLVTPDSPELILFVDVLIWDQLTKVHKSCFL
uniref:Uncharacterized protein n=1 Tax=Nothobranchius korthausae TaxID=1143690 RepID=A0A1A8FKI6_9TELE